MYVFGVGVIHRSVVCFLPDVALNVSHPGECEDHDTFVAEDSGPRAPVVGAVHLSFDALDPLVCGRKRAVTF